MLFLVNVRTGISSNVTKINKDQKRKEQQNANVTSSTVKLI